MKISLGETDTFWIIDIPSTWVALDDDSVEEIKTANIKYEEVHVHV